MATGSVGVNRLRQRARPGDEGVEFRRRLTVDLSFDHRVVDGADAARFLDTLADELGSAEAFVPTPEVRTAPPSVHSTCVGHVAVVRQSRRAVPGRRR